MQAMTLDTKEADFKWWAAQDARMRNIKNASTWTDADKTRAERMKLGLALVYGNKQIYIAYGKRGISIKVDGAYVVDRKNLALLEQDYDKVGIKKKITPQGVIYNIPRG